MALVADGVGGLEGGGAAAACVVSAAQHLCKASHPFTTSDVITHAHHLINSLSFDSAATTASVVMISDGLMEFCHTGDSRIYILRGNGIRALTEDQTEVAVLIREGVLTAEDARSYRRRNILAHSIEKGQDLKTQGGRFSLVKGDRILLLTDGVHKIVKKLELRDMSLYFPDVQEFARELVGALSSQLIDDASFVLVEY